MSLCSTNTTIRWMSRFRENRGDFIDSQLTTMAEVLSCPIHTGLITHMLSRWNPDTSVFHIGDKRICPTVEEFKALLQIKETTALSLIPYASSPSLTVLLQKEMGFTPFVCKLLFKENYMDLQGWSSIAFDEVKVQSIPESGWTLATATMVLAHFFLSPADSRPSTKVFEVAHKMLEQGYDISAMVLAETLMGLTEQSRAHKVEPCTRGSPHTLNLWLLEKLAFLAPVPNNSTLDSKGRKSRFKAATPQPTITDQHQIRDTLPWYEIQKMMYSTDQMLKVTIHGLVTAVSYDTTYLHRQYGLQTMPAAPVATVLTRGMITFKMHNDYLNKLSSTHKLSIQYDRTEGLERYLAEQPKTEANTSQHSQKRQKVGTITPTAAKPKKHILISTPAHRRRRK